MYAPHATKLFELNIADKTLDADYVVLDLLRVSTANGMSFPQRVPKLIWPQNPTVMEQRQREAISLPTFIRALRSPVYYSGRKCEIRHMRMLLSCSGSRPAPSAREFLGR